MTDKDTPTPRTDARAKWLKNDICYKAPEQAYTTMVGHVELVLSDMAELERETVELRQQLAELERGEYICNKCGLRKDSEHEKGDF